MGALCFNNYIISSFHSTVSVLEHNLQPPVLPTRGWSTILFSLPGLAPSPIAASLHRSNPVWNDEYLYMYLPKIARLGCTSVHHVAGSAYQNSSCQWLLKLALKTYAPRTPHLRLDLRYGNRLSRPVKEPQERGDEPEA